MKDEGGRVKIPTLVRRFRADSRGFTLLELVVVVCIIAVLFTVALYKYLDLLVDVERGTMEQNVGILRSAVALQVAARVARGEPERMLEMVDSNPMAYLSEVPFNYRGEFAGADPAQVEGGTWYFERDEQTLVYRVNNHRYFRTSLPGPPRARFRIQPVHDEGRPVGLTLKSLEPYRWLKEPEGEGWFQRKD